MDWDEACKFLWRGPTTGEVYTFKIEDGCVFYKTVSNWIRWSSIMAINPDRDLISYNYKVCGTNPEYDLSLTPQEKVLKKVALMESRWKTFQKRKHNG